MVNVDSSLEAFMRLKLSQLYMGLESELMILDHR